MEEQIEVTVTAPPESNLTPEKRQAMRKRWESLLSRFELTIAGSVVNLSDYDVREVDYPEGGRVLTTRTRTPIEQVLDPRPTDMILWDRKGKAVYLLGGEPDVFLERWEGGR